MATSGPRLDSGIVSFDFQPSIGILARDIDKLGLEFSSFKEPLQKSIKDVMIPSFDKNFAAQGRPAWTPMSEATRMIREKFNGGGGGSTKLLDKTGALRTAVTSESLWSVSDTFAAVKSLPASVWYGNIHQAGFGGMGSHIKAQMKKGVPAAKAAQVAMRALDKKILSGHAKGGGGFASTIPARPFVMFQDEDEEAVARVFDEWLAIKLAEAGFIGGAL